MNSIRGLVAARGVVLAGLIVTTQFAAGQGQPDYEQAPVRYSAATPKDELAALQTRIASGDLALGGDGKAALTTLLKALRVPVESQVLVFTKTSLQRGRIRPERPRALYFSDTMYVGWVPGGLIEVAAIDAELGPVFYAIDLPGRGKEPARVTRDSDCLRCHGGTFVRDIPAVFVRSVFPSASGEPLLRYGTQVVDDETPFEHRWGGWYVTGYRGAAPHRGNVLCSEENEQLVFAPSRKRPDELGEFFSTTEYLAPTSDVVALLVLEHQMTVQNSLTRAAFAARKMLAYQHGLQVAFKEPQTDEPAYDSVKSVFAGAVQDVVDRLLFRGAAALPEGVVGSEAFRRTFVQDAPRSRAGHALKDLQLGERIFQQRCSYLIYSAMFHALPAPLKNRIYDRLQAALLSRDPKDRYSYLATEEKERIHQILVETHPEAVARWRQAQAAAGSN